MYLTFNHPEYLWYLVSIPVLILSHFAFLKYTKRKAIRFANFQALKRVEEQNIITKNYAILFIRIGILFFLILAISDTTLWYMGLTYQNDYVLAMDTSSSMTGKDLSPSRIEVAKEYSKRFIDQLQGESSIGIVSFAGSAFIEQLPTKDRAALKSTLSVIDISQEGGTNIPDAIITSTNLLLNSKKGKTIVLLTDGSNTAGYFSKDPIKESTKYAHMNNVIIYTVGIGSNAGPIGYLPEYYNISAVYDEQTLVRIANDTGGRYFAASSNDELQKAYQEILYDSRQAYLSVNLGVGLLIAALGLFFLEWFLVNTRYKSLP